MKPIWYFVGLILLSMGAIIFLTGLYLLVNPPSTNTVLSATRPNIWWGGLMTIAGVIFVIRNRNIRV